MQVVGACGTPSGPAHQVTKPGQISRPKMHSHPAPPPSQHVSTQHHLPGTCCNKARWRQQPPLRCVGRCARSCPLEQGRGRGAKRPVGWRAHLQASTFRAVASTGAELKAVACCATHSGRAPCRVRSSTACPACFVGAPCPVWDVAAAECRCPCSSKEPELLEVAQVATLAGATAATAAAAGSEAQGMLMDAANPPV